MYVAVDVYTDDLRHMARFPPVGRASAHAFLLALAAPGDRPQVRVRDLNQDYGAGIAAVGPSAGQHACVLHALHAWRRQLRAISGKESQEQHPEAVVRQEHRDRLFQAKTKRTAQRR